jgi:hypothetical protein
MLDQKTLLRRVREFAVAGQSEQAERELLVALSALELTASADDRLFLANQLAQFYSLPMSQNLGEAEKYFLQCEAISPSPYRLYQTAMFYFYCRKDYSMTIAKAYEIEDRWDRVDNGSYYSFLVLKGHSLMALGNIDIAKQVLDEILGMIESSPSGLPYGDELNLISETVPNPDLTELSRKILRQTVSRIRAPEYAQRARTLLQEWEAQPY